MSDANPTGAPTTPPNPGPTTPTGTVPTPPDNGASQSQIDTSKWTQADWDKVYSDPNLYTNPRFKSLNESAKKARELEAAQKKAEEETLTKNKQFEELANKKGQEAEQWKQQATEAKIDNNIGFKAAQLGALDVEAVTKLIDRTNIKIDESGNITGVAEALEALAKSKAYLFGKGNGAPNLGTPTSPGAGNTTPAFKLSQMKDARFYREHQAEIDKAYAEGRIDYNS